jgi:hypothetical protein
VGDVRGRSDYTDEELLYSHSNWNRPLGYGCKFDVVKLQQAGVSQYVDGDRFYSVPGNDLYDWALLKLHGSLNWFRYLPFRRFPAFDGIQTLPADKLEHALLIDGHWWFGEPPDFDGWYIDPILVTPVLYKERYLSEPLYSRILQPLWHRARETLTNTTQLIVIGYSFPRTDFHVEKMFREAFADHDLERVVIVNPDRDVDRKVRALTHYRGGLETFDDLRSYLKASGAAMVSEAMADWPQRASGI